MSEAVLAEIAEHDAEGTIAGVYVDIRHVLGLPVVNLVYRHLATEPARLVEVWNALRPNLVSRAVDEAARRLLKAAAAPTVSPLSPNALAAVAIDAHQIRLAHATLDAYARANSRNLLAMHALLNGCRGTAQRAEVLEPEPSKPILPMASLDTLPEPTLELLREMSAALVGDDEPRLVPSLLRHFATAPALLALLWTTLRPVKAELAACSEAVAAEARGLAAALPEPLEPLRKPSDRRIAARFVQAMSTLLVTGEAVRAAIPDSP